MPHSVSTYLAGLVAHLVVAFLSGSGLVAYSGLLGIAEFVAELVAHLGFRTHFDTCFLVVGPHTTDSLTGS